MIDDMEQARADQPADDHPGDRIGKLIFAQTFAPGLAQGHPDSDARGGNDDQPIPAEREVPQVE